MNGRHRQYNNNNTSNHQHYHNNQRQEHNQNQYHIRNQPNVTSNNNSNDNTTTTPSNQIIFMSQPNPTQQGQNGNMIPSLIGQPLIPIDISSKITSYTQMNKDIIAEVKAKQLHHNQSQDINTLYKSSKDKCDLHTLKLSDKCRKCKLIQCQLEQQQQQEQSATIKPIESPQAKQSTPNQSLSSFTINKNSISGNLNSLILNNILSCQYFQEVLVYRTFQEVIDEIIANVTNIEAWAVGISGVPSTFFCCFYRLVLLSLTNEQVIALTKHKNTYVRIAGILYIRYLSDPSDLWKLLSPFIDDDTMFNPTVDKKTKISIGEYVVALFKDYNHYGTRLPRIPTQIERDIKMNLLMKEEYEERRRRNELVIMKDAKGLKCKIVVVNKEEEKRSGGLGEEDMMWDYVSYDEKKKEVVMSCDGKEKNVRIGDVEIVDMNQEKERNVRRSERENKHSHHYNDREHRHQYKDDNECYYYKKKHRNDDRRKDKDEGDHYERDRDYHKQRHHRYSRSRSGCRNHRSRSRSRLRSKSHSKKPYINYQDKALKKILENERNAAIARGKDYAVKPTSFKKSISVKVPGITKKTSRSPSPIEQNIKILPPSSKPQPQILLSQPDPQPHSSSYSKEYLQRQAHLKKQYNSIPSTKYPKKSGSDYIGPDIMKLG